MTGSRITVITGSMWTVRRLADVLTAVEHRYRPKGGALEAFRARDGEVLLSGPAGTGKSRAAMEKLHLVALLNPGMRGLILRKTLVSLGSTALVTWRRHVVPEALEHGIVWYYGGSQEEAPQYRYENGSSVLIGGMDKPTKIMSSEYDMIYVQEAIELDPGDWEACTTRLRNGVVSFQQLIADTNPDKDTHWLKARCDGGSTRMVHSRHEDNPVLFGDDGNLTEFGASYIARLDKLTGVRYLRLRRGLWVASEGICFEDWDPAVHLIDPFDIPADWKRWWAVDFGFTNPFVCQMWAEDPDGRLFLYREIYHTKRTPDEHAKRILRIVTDDRGQWIEPKPVAIVCDHDAAGRRLLTRELRLATTPARKTVDVSDGIALTTMRMRKAGDGLARIFIFKNALVERDEDLVTASKPTRTAEEIPGYIWDMTGGKKIKETPRKEDDHGCDAMRYLVVERDRGRPRVHVLRNR